MQRVVGNLISVVVRVRSKRHKKNKLIEIESHSIAIKTSILAIHLNNFRFGIITFAFPFVLIRVSYFIEALTTILDRISPHQIVRIVQCSFLDLYDLSIGVWPIDKKNDK